MLIVPSITLSFQVQKDSTLTQQELLNSCYHSCYSSFLLRPHLCQNHSCLQNMFQPFDKEPKRTNFKPHIKYIQSHQYSSNNLAINTIKNLNKRIFSLKSMFSFNAFAHAKHTSGMNNHTWNQKSNLMPLFEIFSFSI